MAFFFHPTTTLINPFKNEIVRISKHILDQINIGLVGKLSVNKWKNTTSVLVIQYFHFSKFLMGRLLIL